MYMLHLGGLNSKIITKYNIFTVTFLLDWCDLTEIVFQLNILN